MKKPIMALMTAMMMLLVMPQSAFADDSDVTPPSCVKLPLIFDFRVQDAESGLASVEVTFTHNATVEIPAFTVGTTAEIVITPSKINDFRVGIVGLRLTDVAGNTRLCQRNSQGTGI